jgi:hypothetical protein
MVMPGTASLVGFGAMADGAVVVAIIVWLLGC